MSRHITLFSADDGVHGLELWATDGTAAGTALVKDIDPGASSSYPDSLTPLGDGRAVFSVDLSTGSANATAIWVTDGTAAGTVAVKTVPSVLLDGFTALGNGRVMFLSFSDDSRNVENLWSTDGTAAGTVLLKTLSTSPFTSDTVVLGNGKAVFLATVSSTDETLWVTDGSTGGTQALGTFGFLSGSFASLGNGQALFAGNDRFNGSKTNTGTELWITDGTTSGTHLVRDIQPGSGSSSPTGLVAFGAGRVLFQAAGASGTGLWLSDGTAAGTVLLKPGLTGVTAFVMLNATTAVFWATDAAHGAELWTTNGTAAGTVLLKDIAPGTTGSYMPGHASSMAALGNGLAVFGANDGAAGKEPWVTDGTAAGTYRLADVAAGSAGSAPDAFSAIGGGKAVFQANAGSGARLWITDGTQAGTMQLKDVAPSTSSSGSPSFLAVDVPSAAPPLFDAAYYLAHNPDVAAAGLDPYEHYEASGWKEGRNPSASFDIADYLAANPDVKAAGIDPLLHYIASGKAEGRAAFAVSGLAKDPLVDAAYYYAHNPDVKAAGVDATAHYLASGYKEGRNPDAFFDTNYYLAQNPDVKAAGVNPLQHFEASGYKEGRQPSLVFDDAKYLQANPDVAAAQLDPLVHYLQAGQFEGRQAFVTGGTAPADPLVDAAFYDAQLGATLIPAGVAGAQQAAWSFDATGWQQGLNPDALFDTGYYLAHNPDVAAAHINPLAHYETNGWKEGRDPSAAFSTTKYLAAYADVKAAGVDPLLHYVTAGQAEGRTAFTA